MTWSLPLNLTVITGMSGAGKSEAIATFEDMGYFCIDNLPPQMLGRVAELFTLEGSKVDKVAVVVDVRAGAYFGQLFDALEQLEADGVTARVVFLEADDASLVARYQSTRRPHPMAVDDNMDDNIMESIRQERSLLADMRDRSDVVVDTSDLNVHELRRRLRETLLAGELHDQLLMTFLSFGYKYGLPPDADLVFDARFLPNPHWVADLRPLRGLDDPVRAYVLERPETEIFLEQVGSLLRFLAPLYRAEGKRQLVVAVGCTGGRHRSVALSEALTAAFAREPDVITSVRHRDVERPG